MEGRAGCVRSIIYTHASQIFDGKLQKFFYEHLKGSD